MFDGSIYEYFTPVFLEYSENVQTSAIESYRLKAMIPCQNIKVFERFHFSETNKFLCP